MFAMFLGQLCRVAVVSLRCLLCVAIAHKLCCGFCRDPAVPVVATAMGLQSLSKLRGRSRSFAACTRAIGPATGQGPFTEEELAVDNILAARAPPNFGRP
jgi:hypothetical protein